MTKAVLGIIGGSGMYELPGLVDVETVPVDSPWGAPSDALVRGRIGQTVVVFLSRHGKGHVHSPSDINYRANIDALKRLGVTDLISLTAVGSFREDLPPGSFVLVDQFVDRPAEGPGVAEQGRDIAKLDAGLRVIGDGADGILERAGVGG